MTKEPEKKEQPLMYVDAVVCPDCGETIYSRARHDFHYCHCGSTAVDGGFDYLRYLSNKLDEVKVVKVEVKATPKKLYDDWNYGKDKFGWIKPKNHKRKPAK